MLDDNCIFCKIIAGKVPVSTVYENDDVSAFMTLEQPNGYQVIVVPKKHVPNVFELNDIQASAIMQATVKVARAIRIAAKCDGLNLYQANGEAARQDVFHFHMQLIPRFYGDTKVHFDWDITYSAREELDRMATEIRTALES